MTYQELSESIARLGSYLCVGIDPDPSRLPAHLPAGLAGVRAFVREIVAATHPYAVAYKVNTAFFESLGVEGWQLLHDVLHDLPSDRFVIADAKRGDIGNTSAQYAKAMLQSLPAHAVTVAPYMGRDSVQPFLDTPNKWTVLLALTSNPGADDFQLLPQADGRPLYAHVLDKACQWAGPDKLMFVVGATRPEQLAAVRAQVPQHFLLVPGVGAQGGSLAQVSAVGLTAQGGLLVNASRSILYASAGADFASAAASEASRMATEMKQYLRG